jgi:hypothetical protein
MRPTPPASWTLAVLGLAAAALLAAVSAGKRPDLTGTWKLDRDASDDPGRLMRESRGPGGGGGGGMGMGRGGHGHGGDGLHRGRGDSSESGPPDVTEWFAALETLRIVHTEPLLKITDARGRERIIYTDGRKTEEEHSHGGTTAVRASWKDGFLEIVSTPQTGPKVEETYAVAADGSQLTVTMKVGGDRRGEMTIRRIYTPSGSGSSKSPPPGATPAPGPARPGNDEDQSI